MRFFRNTKEGLWQGLFVGYVISSFITLTSTDFELLTGGSIKCLMSMLLLTLSGGLVGFANAYRRDPREQIPDTFDNVVMLVGFAGSLYMYSRSPTFFSVAEDLKRRWDNDFQLQPAPKLEN